MFYLIGILLSTFLTFLLLIKKNKSKADKILFVWLFLISIHQVLFYITETHEINKYPFLLGVELPMPILHGVFLYFYTLAITGNKLKKKWYLLLHLLPGLSLLFLAVPFYVLSNVDKIYVFENNGVGFEWYLMYSEVLISVSGLFYSIWTLILVKKHQSKIQNRFSNTDKKELQWLRSLSIGYGVIWIITAFFDGSIIFSVVVILVLFIGFFGINQLNIFYSNIESPDIQRSNMIDIEDKLEKKTILHKEKNKIEKYAKSGLTDEVATDIYEHLKTLMGDNSYYKKEELTLIELAKELNAHPNHLSQVINEKEGKNFYNYINSLRIKEFIKLASLPENKKYTMISLAYDCGFSTKSTFNKHFKKQTGETPTQFFNS